MIDFRYHLVSIVAVFLALAIGIVLGSTALQGAVLDGLRATSDSLTSQLNAATNGERVAQQANSANDTFLQIAEPKLLKGMLAGDSVVFVAEPNASSGVVDGLEKAATYAGAAITGTVTLYPKFNDLSGSTQANLSTVNNQQATINGIALDPATSTETVYQQEASQVIASAILEQTAGEPGAAASGSQGILKAYAQNGYLNYTNFTGRATVAIIVTPQGTATDGPDDPADQVLLALAGQFANASAATVVAGPVVSPSPPDSPVSVLRNSSVSSQVSSVDNANTTMGQITAIWALSNQIQGGKPGSYGVSSGASKVSPVPSPVPSVTPTVTPTSTKGTGKVKKTVSTK